MEALIRMKRAHWVQLVVKLSMYLLCVWVYYRYYTGREYYSNVGGDRENKNENGKKSDAHLEDEELLRGLFLRKDHLVGGEESL